MGHALRLRRAAELRLEDERELLLAARQRLAFKRRLEQHGEHVVAIDGLDHHLVFGAGAVGGPLMTSSTWAGNMLQPFTLNMSSVRPVSVAMRGWRLPQAQVPGTSA